MTRYREINLNPPNQCGTRVPFEQSPSLLGQAKLELNNPPDALPKHWYTKFDGNDFRPAKQTQMQFLMQPLKLCRHLQVIATALASSWRSFGRNQNITKALSTYSLNTRSAQRMPKTIRKTLSVSGFSFSALVSRVCTRAQALIAAGSKDRTAFGPAISFAGSNALAPITSADASRRNRKIQRHLKSIPHSTHKRSILNVAFINRQTFPQESQPSHEPLLQELQRSTDVQHSVHAHLRSAGLENVRQFLNNRGPFDKGFPEAPTSYTTLGPCPVIAFMHLFFKFFPVGSLSHPL